MKPNKPPETYANRVAQFEADERKVVSSSLPPTALQPTSTSNIYLDARIAVLNGYKPELRMEIAEMERTGDTDNSTYNRFVCELLVKAKDIPSHGLKEHSIQSCGCFSCRGK